MPTIFSRMSVYLAAVVILISWLISNTFVTVKEEDAQTMDAVQSEWVEVQRFANLSNDQRALLTEMADIENSLDKLRKEGTDKQNNDEEDANEKWLTSFQSDSALLVKSAEDLEELSQRVQPTADLEQLVENNIQRVKAFDTDVQNGANAYREQAKAGQSSQSGQDEANAEGRNNHEEQMAVALQKIADMEGPFDKLNEEIVSLYGKMDSYMTTTSERSAEHATIARWIAYLFSALGTVIGGFGKWLESKH
jgi:hypothetical protein